MKTTLVHINTDNNDKLSFLHHYANSNSTNTAEIKRMWTILIKAIDGELTDMQRYYIFEKYMGNKRQNQIADELGVNCSTVSRHVTAAEKKLRAIARYYS